MPEGFKVGDGYVDITVNLDQGAIERAGGRAGRALGSTVDREVSNSRGRITSTFEGIGDGAGKSSGLRIGAGLLGAVTGAAGKAGSTLAGALSDVGGKGGPAMMVGVLAAVATAAPLAGAVLGASLTAGVAAAGIGIGVAAAMRHPAVKQAASGLKDAISSELDEIGRSWAPTMLEAIGQIKGAIPGIGSMLRGALVPAQSYVKPLVDGFLGLVRNIMPGFNNLIREAGPVIQVLQNGLKQIGTAISDAFTAVSGETDNMAAGLQLVITLLSKGVVFAGHMVAWLAKGVGFVIDFIEPLVGLAAKLPGVGDEFKKWHDEIKNLQKVAHGVGPTLEAGGVGMTALSSATSKASQSSESMALRQKILTGTMAAGADAAGDLKAAMDALNGATQSAEAAEIEFRSAVAAATAGIKENGRSLDLNSEKGRANRTALLNLARAGQAHAQAQYDQTAAVHGTARAESVAQGAYAASRNSLMRVAQQMGMTRSQAAAYADRIMAIPKSWSTNVKAETAAANANLAETQRRINALRGKTIPINVRVTRTGEALPRQAASAYMSTGGPVRGPGPKGVDSVPIVAAPGEHVLTDKEVDAAGGHKAIEAWRAALRGGRSAGPMQPVGGSPRPAAAATQVVNIGSVTLDASRIRDIGDVIEMVKGITTTARAYSARVAAAPGAWM